LGPSKVYRGAQTTTLLGERGKGGKLRQIVIIVLRILASIVGLVNGNSNGRFEG